MSELKDKELIIFDMDGTTLYTLDDLWDTANYALAKKCVDGLHLSENRRLIGEHTIPGEFPIAPTDLITQLFALSISAEPKPHFLQRI